MGKTLTQKQIDHLMANPYTYRVTAKQIFFTKEFKELFMCKREQGLSAVAAFRDLGYDPEIIGRSRVDGIGFTIKKELQEKGGFTEGPSPRNSILNEECPEVSKENFIRMHHELQYLRKELDFLKKILSPENSGK